MSFPYINSNSKGVASLLNQNGAGNENPNPSPGPKRLGKLPFTNDSKNIDTIFGGRIGEKYDSIRPGAGAKTLPVGAGTNRPPSEKGMQPMAEENYDARSAKNLVRKPASIESGRVPVDYQQIEEQQPYEARGQIGQGVVDGPDRFNAPIAYTDQQRKDIIARRQALEVEDDSETKIAKLDRMMNYLLSQMNTIEKQAQNELKRTKIALESERDLRLRLETNLRMNEEHFSMIQNELVSRLNTLESRATRHEKEKQEVNNKFASVEEAQKEFLFFVRNYQNQGTAEMNNVRLMMQERVTEEQQALLKEREKSKALFNEVVRLGEIQEKLTEKIQQMSSGVETRLGQLENRFVTEEQALNQLAVKGEGGFNQISEFGNKLERKVQTLELNLYALGREQLKDKDHIGRLEEVNQRVTDDLKNLLNNLQNDYQSRLDSRVTEIVNRIVMEHEERVRAHDDFRSQVELRERLAEERSKYEREEMRDRYSAMDANVRAEFQRKDEALRSLHSIIEMQFKQSQNALKQEESNRLQNEAMFRQDFIKFQDLVRKEVDLFKNDQSGINSKILEMIKVEVDTRLTSDIELKNHANLLAGNLNTELTLLKENIERQNKKFAQDMKDISKESAERANQLSRYVDSEVKRIDENFTKKYEKLKQLIAKMAEQLKTYFHQFEAIRKELWDKITEVEINVQRVSSEAVRMVNECENRCNARLTERAEALERYCDTRIRPIEEKLRGLGEQVKKSNELILAEIENNHKLFTQKLQRLTEQNEVYHKNNYDNMQKVMEEFDNMFKQLEMIYNDGLDNIGNIMFQLTKIETHFNTELIAERSLRLMGTQQLSEQLSQTAEQMSKNVLDVQLKMQKITNDFKAHTEDYQQTTGQHGEQIADLFNKLFGVYDSIQGVQTKYDKDIELIYARAHLAEVFTRTEFENVKAALMDMTHTLATEAGLGRTFKQNLLKTIDEMNESWYALENRMEKDIPQVMDRKLAGLFERLKRENEDIWKISLKFAGKDTSAADMIKAKDTNLKLIQAVGIDDEYQKPRIKPK